MMQNRVLVTSLEKRFEKLKKDSKKVVLGALKVFKKNNIIVEVYLVGSRKMLFLNKKFRGKSKTASILSFEEPKDFPYLGKRKPIGEIYLNADNIKTELLVHGLLHLFGYNHNKKNDRIKMERKEKFIISNLYQ